MKLTNNFRKSEFTFSQTAVRKGVDNSLPANLTSNLVRMAEWLQVFRDRLCAKYGRDIVIVITSGYRCPKLNKKIGGSKTSAHMKMLAVDIIAPSLTPTQLQRDVFDLMQDRPYDQCIDEFCEWLHIGLADENVRPRMQNLIARKRLNAFGRLKTVYSVF